MTLFGDFVTGQTLSFQRMRALLLESGGGLQEGVVGANDLKVAQRGAGANMSVDIPAGAAWVQVDTGTRNGLAHAYNDATANVAVTASNATNPRIDQAILRYNDTSIPTGSGNTPTLEILAGAATATADLTNRLGAAALPNDCLRLADILVPATSTSVTTANIRDRRLWARGVRWSNIYTGGNFAGFAAFTTVTTGWSPRIECSGGDIQFTFGLTWQAGATARVLSARVTMDGTGLCQRDVTVPVSGFGSVNLNEAIAPAAGSHVFAFQLTTVAAEGTVFANGTQPITASITELARPNTNNT